MRSLRVGLIVALTLATSAAVRAQPASSTGLPSTRLTNSRISLTEAVQLTVQSSPDVARASQRLMSAQGRARQARGLFDLTFGTRPMAGYTVQQMMPFLVKQEHDKREIINAIGDGFTLLTTALDRVVANGRAAPPRCPANLNRIFAGFSYSSPFLSAPVNIDRRDTSEITLLGTNTFLSGTPFGDILGGVTLDSLCTSNAVLTLTPETFSDLYRELAPRIDQSGGQGLQGLLTSVSQIPRESRALQAQISRAIATRARLALERLGPIPQDQLKRTFEGDLTFRKTFRTGLIVMSSFLMQMQDQNFRHKSYDASFGGMGVPPNFRADVSGTFIVPLGRDAGRTAVAAPERASVLAANGEQAAVAFEISRQAYRTSLSYLGLIGAQESLRALLESQTRQRRIIELTEAGVSAGDLPRIEISRARARAERVNSAISDARAAVVTARVGLADTIGISAEDLAGTPEAADNFATIPVASPVVDGLIAGALARRLDVRAAQAQRAAAEVLADGARANVRRRFDFQVTGGLSNLYDSPFYKFLPDEVNPIIPQQAPIEPAIHYYSGRGFYRAIEKRWEPYVVAQLTVQFPFANNVAKGRFARTQATASARRIDVEDLSRRVQANVVDVTARLRHSLASVRQWENAVRNNDDLIAGSLLRFETRDLTLVDTLLTEEAVTSDRLQLVRQRQGYLSLLARLRFETGEIIDVGSGESTPTTFRFDPTPFVSR